jgi:hypothetical protein
MTALVDVILRPAEAVDQESTQALLGAVEVVGRIHRPQHIVARNLRVERVYEAREAVRADARENLVFCQRGMRHSISMSDEPKSDEAPKSALELAMERLRRKDVEEGRDERLVSAEQKEEIGAIRKVYAARIAQAEILHKSGLLSTFDPAEREKLETQYRQDLERLNTERDRKIASVRGR